MIKKLLKKIFNRRQRIYLKGIIPNLRFKIKLKPIIVYDKNKYKVTVFERKRKNVFNGYYDINPLKNGKLLVNINTNNCKTSNGYIEIGYFEIATGKYFPLTKSKAWCWQQGNRLRWSTVKNDVINFNDCLSGKYCNIFFDITHKKIVKKIDFPLYDVDKNEKYGLSLNFSRLQRLRPGYGYNVLKDLTSSEKAPENDGVFLIDLNKNTSKLIISLSKMAEGNDKDLIYEHYVNHISISPKGDRFIFFHIYSKGTSGWVTELCSANIDGSEFKVLDNINLVSHYTWKNNETVLITGINLKSNEFFYKEYDVKGKYTTDITEIGLKQDGHPTYINDNLLISDTYPKESYQTLFKYDLNSKIREDILRVYADPRFDGEYRCDLHPKYDATDNTIFIDSTYKNKHRKIVMIQEVEDGK